MLGDRACETLREASSGLLLGPGLSQGEESAASPWPSARLTGGGPTRLGSEAAPCLPVSGPLAKAGATPTPLTFPS